MRLGPPDASGRQAPEEVEGADFDLPADLVIKALGFDPEDLPAVFAAPDLAVTRWGTVKVDFRTMMTTIPRRLRRRRHRARRLAGRLGDPRRPRRRRRHPPLPRRAARADRGGVTTMSQQSDPRARHGLVIAALRSEPRATTLIERDRDAYRRHGRSERDACGVGLVCAIDGKPRREVVELAIQALKAVWHRGAVDADGKTGDGAGILVERAAGLLRATRCARIGHKPAARPDRRRPGLPAAHRPRRPGDARATIVETEVLRFGFYIYGWRQVPVDTSVIGEKANATRPEIEQIMLSPTARAWTSEALERELFICRRRIEKRGRGAEHPATSTSARCRPGR